MTTPTTVPVRLQLRADTAANWTSVNPILLANELGRETDTGKIKIGNGTSTWTSLAYQAWATLPVAVNAGGTGQTSYTNGQLLIGNTTGNTLTKATLTAGSGVAITNGTGSITVAVDSTVVTTAQTGTVTSTMIADGTIVDADVNASAAIAGTKISPNFGSQNVVTTGTSTAASLIPTGSSVPGNGVYLPAANSVGISTNGAQRATIDSSGRLLVGTATALNVSASAGLENLQVAGTGANSNASFSRFSNNAASPNLNFAKSRGTTVNANEILINGDDLGSFRFHGADGTNYTEAVRILAEVDGTPGQVAGTFVIGTEYRILTTGTTDFTLIGAADSNPGTIFTATDVGTGTGTAIRTAGDMPGRLVFSTTPDNTGAPVERMRLDSSGRLGLGTSSPNEQLEVAGNIHVSGADRSIFNRSNNALTFGTNNTERARITNSGALLVGTTATPTGASSGAVVAENRVVISSTSAGRNQIIADDTGTVTATTGTAVFKFKSLSSASGRACYVKLAISQRASNNTPSNLPAAEYAFQLHNTNTGVCSINSTTTIFEHTYDRATHFAFADLGSGECTVTLTNPTSVALAGSHRVEIITHGGTWTLDSVTTT
jgi:hypothetical protein